MITSTTTPSARFARKVRMVLEHKGLAFKAIDGLTPGGHATLAAVNPCLEVPVLIDDDLVVINSSHIGAYLEQRYPARCGDARFACLETKPHGAKPLPLGPNPAALSTARQTPAQ